jgi:hypothetical protein
MDLYGIAGTGLGGRAFGFHKKRELPDKISGY